MLDLNRIQTLNMSDFSQKWSSLEWHQTLEGLALAHTSSMNPIQSLYYASNKIYQAHIAKKIGVNVPEFIVSNNKEEITKFFNKHDSIIAKPLHGEIIKKRNNDDEILYANIISKETIDIANEKEIMSTPILFQEYIKKELELRVTIVDKKIFSCAIHSQSSHISSIDWRRYDIKNTPHYIYVLPKNIEDKLLQIMKHFNLIYGAFDLVKTKNGEYYFLEVNPTGQWLWIEELTGLKISQSIAEWLISN